MKSTIILFFVLLTGCATYSIDYVVETFDSEGNIISRHSAKGRALVGNSSDEVVFRLSGSGDEKNIEFGKTNTNASSQIEALDVIASQISCSANPLSC